jgi:hypothetical protein
MRISDFWDLSQCNLREIDLRFWRPLLHWRWRQQSPLKSWYCHILGVCDYRRGMDWWIGFLDHLYMPVGTTITAPLLIFAIHRSPQHALSVFPARCVNSRSLATASKSGDFSASWTHVVTVRRISRISTLVNWTVTPIVFKITPRHGTRRKHSLSIVVEACLPHLCIATVAAQAT